MDTFDNSGVETYKTQDCLIVPIQTELYDDYMNQLGQVILAQLNDPLIQGVIIDLSGVEIIDVQNFQQLVNLTRMIMLMGRATTFTGFRPAVVAALVNLNIDIKDIKAFTDIEACLQYLHQLYHQAKEKDKPLDEDDEAEIVMSEENIER